MTEKAFTKLWNFFGGTLLSLSFLLFLRTTGMDAKGDSFGILGYSPQTVAALALPMDFVLLTIFLMLSAGWTRRWGRNAWTTRMPLFYFEKEEVNVVSKDGRLYQRCIFALFFVVPLALSVQMTDRFINAPVFGDKVCTVDKATNKVQCKTTCPGAHEEVDKVARGARQFQFQCLRGIEGMLRFGQAEGPEYFALLPWIYSLWGLGLLVYWTVVVRAIFAGPKKPVGGATPGATSAS